MALVTNMRYAPFLALFVSCDRDYFYSLLTLFFRYYCWLSLYLGCSHRFSDVFGDFFDPLHISLVSFDCWLFLSLACIIYQPLDIMPTICLSCLHYLSAATTDYLSALLVFLSAMIADYFYSLLTLFVTIYLPWFSYSYTEIMRSKKGFCFLFSVKINNRFSA